MPTTPRAVTEPIELSADAIRSALVAAAPAAAAWRIEAVASTGSTNQDLLQRVREAAPEVPIVRAADEQQAGRGRSGRSWHAPRGAALLFSVAVPLPSGRGLHPATALAAGVAVAGVLRDAGAAVELKWPNDLLLAEAKLGGILAEVAVDPRRAVTIVVGVGINLVLDAVAREAIGARAAALADRLDSQRLVAGRERWIGALAAAVEGATRAVADAGFAPWRERFETLLAWRGRAVELREAGRLVASGKLLGVDEQGQLLLDAGRRVLAQMSGDVSLRLAGAGS